MSKDKSSDSIAKFWNGRQSIVSSQYLEGRFIGDGITLKMGVKDYASIIWDTLFKKTKQIPDHPLPSQRVDLSRFNGNENKKLKSIWLGHSSLIIHAGGYRILTDPVFEDRITPLKLARFHKELPVDVREISNVDVVVISHDNFDHLNKYSIKILAPVTKRFLVPLGVGSYLSKWGVEPKKVIELDWWQDYHFDSNLTFTATPARHFSGRGVFTRNKTLWNSWVIGSSECNLFFSGDSGYFDGFKKIGKSFGPFDLTYMQCGAYYRAWRQIQMNPEEAIKAHLDLKGKILHPIHWGTFNMSFHAWYDPIQRLLKEANRTRVTTATPIPGETIAPFEGKLGSNWWESISNP
jgi:L-ascorbate metabolism protein UlaG (beta-lactamase superfamily)